MKPIIKLFFSIIILLGVVLITQPHETLKANLVVRMPVPKKCKDKNGNVYSYATDCDGNGNGCDMDDCPPEPE